MWQNCRYVAETWWFNSSFFSRETLWFTVWQAHFQVYLSIPSCTPSMASRHKVASDWKISGSFIFILLETLSASRTMLNFDFLLSLSGSTVALFPSTRVAVKLGEDNWLLKWSTKCSNHVGTCLRCAKLRLYPEKRNGLKKLSKNRKW